jgi:hypothetical protein
MVFIQYLGGEAPIMRSVNEGIKLTRTKSKRNQNQALSQCSIQNYRIGEGVLICDLEQRKGPAAGRSVEKSRPELRPKRMLQHRKI